MLSITKSIARQSSLQEKYASLNVGYQSKSGPGKIHEAILVVSQISVVLTYIEGRQMVAPKLLNIQFERP